MADRQSSSYTNWSRGPLVHNTAKDTWYSKDQNAYQLFVSCWTKVTGRPLGGLTESVWRIARSRRLAWRGHSLSDHMSEDKVRDLICATLLSIFEEAEELRNSPSSSPEHMSDIGEDWSDSQCDFRAPAGIEMFEPGCLLDEQEQESHGPPESGPGDSAENPIVL